MAINKHFAFCITKDMINAGLKGNELIVYAYIIDRAYNMMGSFNGGIGTICEDLKLSEPTVINIVKKLAGYGIIEKKYYLDKNNIKRISLIPVFLDGDPKDMVL